MSETPGSPEYYTPPPQAAPTPPPPPSISDAATSYGASGDIQYANPYTAAPGQRVQQPTQPMPQPGYYPAPPRPAQGLAITALVLGIIALVTAWVPAWGTVVGIVAVIFGIIALAKRQSKGMAITGLVTGGVGAIVSAGILAVMVFSINWASNPDNWFSYTPGTDDYFETDGTTLGAVPVDGGVHVVEQGFGPTAWDDSIWWYVVVLENPGGTPFVATDLTIQALDASGAVIDDEWNYASLPTGQTAVTGLLYEVGDAEVASLAVVGPDAGGLTAAASGGTIEASNIETVTDEYTTVVTGSATSTYDIELYGAEIVIVARDGSGEIIAVTPAYVDGLQPGETTEFEAYFDAPLPDGTTYETYAVTY